MTRHTPINAKANPLCLGDTAGVVSSPAATPATCLTADASKVSGRDFLDLVTGNSPEKRALRREQEIAKCIAAIKRGDTYGFPPVMVAECKQIMAEEDAALVYVERIAPGRIAL